MAFTEEQAAAIQATLNERKEHIRESWIRAMEAKIVRENLSKCYKIEGVNHIQKCKHLANRYTEMLRENKVKGYKHIDI
ncbi:hypothetical protein CERSUDRAFT_98039 [Gelatoporia subvermispora B]|uniref:NADH-ubiquinone oxidoreductase 12 kDa subunit n=1 Tax=Ceriporiopsis subvermispora (strain B) TaxID=914234 RepID=M2R6X5_CERS8|nr:hypothetical protein CERSUDRAFT_98039 [Gelatoporia subvermispora B]